MKKILAVALALVMMLAVSIPAFAADITTDGGTGESVVKTSTQNEDGEEAAGKIMNDAIELYNNLIDKVNNPDKSDPKKIKEHYRNIRKELNEGVDALCERLSSIAGEEKAE